MKALPACLGARMKNGRRRSFPRPLPSPIAASFLWPRAASRLNSAACSCFCPCWWIATCPAWFGRPVIPGSKMIPAPQAWLSLLGLKLSSTERKNHVMDLVFDEGLALFAGLNVVPKTTYLETYSHSFSPKTNEKLRKLWIGVCGRRNY